MTGEVVGLDKNYLRNYVNQYKNLLLDNINLETA